MRKKTGRKRRGAVVFLTLLTAFAVCSGAALNRLKGEFAAISTVTAANAVPTAKDAEDWKLILVNGQNPIPDGYSPELIELDNGQRVDSRIYPALQEMFDRMRREDIYPVVGEGYRTAEEQRRMMEDRTEAYINEGYTPKRAQKQAESEVAPVGKSEHQLGMAVDINADKTKSDNEEVYEWLRKNACKYGFILRYPMGKSPITGIEYEAWHYRYVGKDAAEYIMSEGICLEEYIALIGKGAL